MPSVPEFLLRKLYVPGSLKALQDGFSFQLNNSLMAVSVTGMQISADGEKIAGDSLYLQFAGQVERSAAAVSESAPVTLLLNQPLTLRAVSGNTQPKKLLIEANTAEMGLLAFSIDLKAKKQNPIAGMFSRSSAAVRFAWLTQKVKRDPLHPVYHFTAPANWMNDPNGLVSWQGQTHLFYQYNPQAPVWGTPHWGHAVSTDLVRWRHLPVALSPHPGRPDQDGCWSGSALITEEGPVFFYTGVFPESVCLARLDKAFRTLVLDKDNPVISAPPKGVSVEGFRDPNVWKEGDRWYLTLGSGIKGEGGCVFLYESTDLRHWNYLHPLLQGNLVDSEPFPTGTMWECPQVFEIDGEYFLFISGIVAPGSQYTYYFQGEMRDHRFVPHALKRLDHGFRVFYAPLSFVDDKERRVMFGWLVEERSESTNRKAGWAGALSLPRLLSLSAQKELLVDPVPEVDNLRRALLHSFSGALAAHPVELGGGQAVLHCELLVTATAQQGGEVIFTLAESPNAAERTLIIFDFDNGHMRVDTRTASLDPQCRGDVKEAPLPLHPGKPLEMRLFVDGSVLEVYANHRVVVSSRLYPTRTSHLRLFGQCCGGLAQVISLKLWKLGNR